MVFERGWLVFERGWLAGSPACDSIVFAWDCVGSVGNALALFWDDPTLPAVARVEEEEDVFCAATAADPGSGRASARFLIKEEAGLLRSSTDDTIGVVPLSFNKLVQFGTLVAFGSESVKHSRFTLAVFQLLCL